VLLVDDHATIRESLAAKLDVEADLEIVGEAGDGPEAVVLISRLRPDIVAMDVNLGEMNGIEAARRIKAADPGTRVRLSMHEDHSVAQDMREAGACACAYLTMGGQASDLSNAIRSHVAGR
jgi:DNA-binding NarL/FixJ family response regulator